MSLPIFQKTSGSLAKCNDYEELFTHKDLNI